MLLEKGGLTITLEPKGITGSPAYRQIDHAKGNLLQLHFGAKRGLGPRQLKCSSKWRDFVE